MGNTISTEKRDAEYQVERRSEPARRSNRFRVRRWLLKYPRGIPLGIFALIAAITALSVYSIERNVEQRETAQMRTYAQAIGSELERRGNSSSAYLRAAAALFSSVDEVTPTVFNQFVSELRLNVDSKGSQGIGWISAVPRASEAEFLETIRLQQPGFPAIRPKSGTALPRLAPVTFFYPDTPRNRAVLGLNMYSDPVRAEAMDEARRTVSPIASGAVDLAASPSAAPDAAHGFNIFMPVYAGDASLRDSESSLSGFVFTAFDADAFLQAAIESAAPADMSARLYDGQNLPRNLLAEIPGEIDRANLLEQPISIANRSLTLVIGRDDPMFLDTLSMLTLLFGLAVASLLMLLARLLTRQAHEDETRLTFFEEQHSIRNSLSRELNHRVKNTLANVLSIISLTRRRSSNLDEFADSLEGRIRSLSATHDLLTGTDWGTTPIRAIVEAELQHFANGGINIIDIKGAPVEIAPNDALSFGLAIHELATNAAKYGALSVPGGAVHISWQMVGDGLAEIEWLERGGPAVPHNRQRGFGTDLIEKIVAHELRQPVQLVFEPEGVRCTLRIPVRQRGDFQIREAAQ
ncbi:CHASE domain-containing protein [Erythrobacter sp. MTPC3]|uniref:CHASE domain-containing protein n=1 Tax=Erythrobacter sp. MTPC3 TaxID=3056564 RepID=UPI0036F1987E